MRQSVVKISLSEEERLTLTKSVEDPHCSLTVRHRSHILLELDSSTGKAISPLVCSQRVGVSERTVRNIRKLYAQKGLEGVLQLRRSPNSDTAHKKIDAKTGECILFLARSKQPDGYAHWTIALLAKVLLEQYQMRLGKETLRLFLTKHGIYARTSPYWSKSQK